MNYWSSTISRSFFN